MGAIWIGGKWHGAVRRRKWYAAGCCTAMSCCSAVHSSARWRRWCQSPGSACLCLYGSSGRHERALDLYEGYPHLYRKENLSVTLDGGERDIMAYVMTGEREYGVPARSYYETIARGYADAGFDISVLNEAVQESVRRMLNEVAPEEELNGTWQMTL